MNLPTYLVAIAACSLCGCQVSLADAAPLNVALGKTVTLNTPSTESYTIDKDPAQLTDGKYAGEDFDAVNRTSSLWVQKGALTWRVGKDPVSVTIDLGETMPISGVSFSTAAGSAGVFFPSFIGILVSDDAKLWHYQGDLVRLSHKNGAPLPNDYSKFRFVTHDLKTKGRYIALTIQQSPYTVVDEVEVYAGDKSWFNLPPGGQVFNSLDAIVINQKIQHRLAADITTVQKVLLESSLSAAAKSQFTNRLDKVASDNDIFGSADKDISTILPISDNHRTAMAIYGEIIGAEGVAPLTIWHQNRYAWIPFITQPFDNQERAIDITTLKNEIRSDALLLTNASGKEKTVEVELRNPPANTKDGWLKVDSVAWTDTYQGIPVADALIPAPNVNGKYLITVPAGFTRKVWFTVDASKVPSGNYKSTFLVDGQKIPFNLLVSILAMKRPRMSLTMWDNSDIASIRSGSSRGITARNKAAALAMMKSHFLDSPWADRELLPWPKAEDYNAQNKLKSMLNLSDFDKWVAEWPQARTFFIFIHAGENETFAGAKRGSAEFNARLGAWAAAFSAHLKTLNLRPQQVSLLIVDEPRNADWQDDVIADWARAIRIGAPDLSLNSDPLWERPDLQKNQEAFTQMNILILNSLSNSIPEVRNYYQKLRAEGRDLWLYSAVGPVRLFNPQHYYRGQAWRVFSIGGKGMGFWSFNDLGGAETAWNDYQTSISYSPAFLDKDTVYNSVHWDSVREGVEDFEVLSMLHDAINSSKNMALKAKAQTILDEAVKAVAATKTNDLWSEENNPELIDQQLQNVRIMLEKLNAG